MFRIAFRNVLRNRRRSLMTALAIAVGASAMILLGEYQAMVHVAMETGFVRGMGHLTVFRKGYFDFGSARPAEYSISSYDSVIALIKNDPVLEPMLVVVTPRVNLAGIVGNSATDKSKTFFGTGFIPSDQGKLGKWDAYGIGRDDGDEVAAHRRMTDGDVDHGLVGTGLARILGLCKPLKIADCPAAPEAKHSFIAHGDAPAGETAPRLDLLSGSSGAPNIVAFYVNQAQSQAIKAADDNYIGMHFKLAQQLVFGGGEHKASAIVIQLKRTADMEPAQTRLDALFAEHGLALEVRDFTELAPQFKQILGYFMGMIGFIAVVMGIVVIFTIANTMSMSVMERTNEIGTARAMGVRRGGIRRQFLLEGSILGAIGATAGIVLASVSAYWINHANITYTPPGNSHPEPLTLLTSGNGGLLATMWIALVIAATLASIVPANKAAGMKVVDALRHV